MSEQVGILCPRCGCRHLEVNYGRHRQGYYFRKRVCRNCGKEVRTKEVAMGVAPACNTGTGIREL